MNPNEKPQDEPPNEYFNVFSRVRPFLLKEKQKTRCINTTSDSEFSMEYRDEHFNIKLDRVFGETANQLDLFNHIQPALQLFAEGVNVTLLAYGHTGSGIDQLPKKIPT